VNGSDRTAGKLLRRDLHVAFIIRANETGEPILADFSTQKAAPIIRANR
jgi:hypothetical protein